MISLRNKDKDNSLLSLNKEELKIKEPKRRKTNLNINRPMRTSYAEILNQQLLRKSITKFRRRSKTLNPNDNENENENGNEKKVNLKRQATRRKKPKLLPTKTLPQKKINNMKVAFSNKSLKNYYSINLHKKKRSTQNVIIKENKNFTKIEKPNLKQVENEILNKIIIMKKNYQRNSIADKDIFLENIDNYNSKASSIKSNINTFQRNKTIKKKIINKESINSNFSNIYKSDSDNFIKQSKIDSHANKAQTVILKKNEKNKLEKGKKFAFTELRRLNEKELDIFSSKMTRNDKIRNIKRIKNLYDSFDDDESEKDDDFHGNIISPKSNIIFFFDFFMVLSSIYCLIYLPLRIAKFDCFCNKENNINSFLLYLIDLLYICDFCISFFRGYYNLQYRLIRNNITIIIHYFKTDFFFDFLESIPIYTFSNYLCTKNKEVNYCFKYNMSSSLIYLKILTSLKLLKIFKVRIKKKNVILNSFFDLFSENYALEKNVDNTFDFIICFLAFHFFVCLNIFLSKHSYPNWIISMELQNETFIYIYLASSYSLIETLTTVGYGDATCQCTTERVFQIIMLAVGVVAYSYIISAFGNLFKNESQSSINYNNNMKILEEIRVDFPNLSYKLYKKIYNHIESKNMSEKKLDSNMLTNSLPYNLKNSILLVMYKSIIKNFKFFKNCENSNFIIQVLSKFIPSTSKKNDFLLFEGEMIEEIIFVKDGRLSLEAAIDMDEPETSINGYFTSNFKGITSTKKFKKFDNKSNPEIVYNRQSLDFENAKFLLNNAVKKQANYLFNEAYEESILDKTKFDKKDTKNNLRNDVLKQEPIKNEEGNYKYIKVLDIRKNENFGGLYMLLRRPSPLSVKVRSKFVELYLLPKKDVLTISKNFNNIWRKIQNIDFHNMISIKRHTFKILNKYIEMNGFVKVAPAEISRYYFLDETDRRASEINMITNSLNSKINNNLFNPKHRQRKSNPIVNVSYSKFKRSNNSLENLTEQKFNNSFNKIIPCKMSFSQIYVNQNQIQSIFNLNNKLNDIVKNNIINENVDYDKKKSNKSNKSHFSRKSHDETKNTIILNQKEENQPETLNRIFTEKRASEIKEEMKKSKNKENRRKIFSLGQKTAKMFKDKNFMIIFTGDNPNECNEMTKNYITSKSFNGNETKENLEIAKTYLSVNHNKSFFDKIPEINIEEEYSLYKFDKNELIQEEVISFSFNSLYKNINIHTNMKYSNSSILQEKTLSFLDKLLKSKNEENKGNTSIMTINSNSLTNSMSKIKGIFTDESKISKQESSNSSFINYEEILNMRNRDIDKDKIKDNEQEKRKHKLGRFENSQKKNNLNDKQIKNLNRKKGKTIKNKKTCKNEYKCKNKKILSTLKTTTTRRNSYAFNVCNTVNLEENSKIESNINNINPKKKRKKEKSKNSDKEFKKKNNNKKKSEHLNIKNNNIQTIKSFQGLNTYFENDGIDNKSTLKQTKLKSDIFNLFQ